MNQTPIYDIKPYLPYCDSHPDALEGFIEDIADYKLEVEIDKELLNQIPEEYHEALMGVLAEDPRPSYHDDPERIYGFYFAGYNKIYESSYKLQDTVDDYNTWYSFNGS